MACATLPQVFADGMASTLDVLALCADVAFRGVLPSAQRRSSDGDSRGAAALSKSAAQNGGHAAEQQQQEQQQRRPSSDVAIELPELGSKGSDSKLGADGSASSGGSGQKDSSGGGDVSSRLVNGSLGTGNRLQLARLQRLSLSAAPVQVMFDVLEPLAHPLRPSEPETPRAFLVIGTDCELVCVVFGRVAAFTSLEPRPMQPALHG